MLIYIKKIYSQFSDNDFAEEETKGDGARNSTQQPTGHRVTANGLNLSSFGPILSEWLLSPYSINSRTAFQEAVARDVSWNWPAAHFAYSMFIVTACQLHFAGVGCVGESFSAVETAFC